MGYVSPECQHDAEYAALTKHTIAQKYSHVFSYQSDSDHHYWTDYFRELATSPDGMENRTH